jgi:hypothetical protein
VDVLEGSGVAAEITAGVGEGGRLVNLSGFDGDEPPELTELTTIVYGVADISLFSTRGDVAF